MNAVDIAKRLMKGIDDEDWTTVKSLLALDAEVRHPAATVRGPEEIAAFWSGSHAPFPGARHDIAATLDGGSTAVVEGVWVGTHTKPMPTPKGEVPPTSKTARVPFCVVCDVDAGRARSIRIYVDQIAFMGQLGLI